MKQDEDQSRPRDVIDIRQSVRRALEMRKPPEEVVKPAKLPVQTPTPERMRHADFVEDYVYEIHAGGRRQIGKAWQVQPRFLKIEGLTAAQLRALLIYRRAFDESERSELKSQLDVGVGGGSGLNGSWMALARLETIAFADASVKRIEARVRVDLPILRAVALFDRDFSDVAIEMFGGREVERFDARRSKANIRAVIVPKSGKDRAAVRERFMAAVDQLADAMMPPRGAPAVTLADRVNQALEVPLVDSRFLDERGFLLPLQDIREIILGDAAPATSEDLHGGTD